MVLGDRGSRGRCLLVWVSGASALSTVMVLVSPYVERLWAARAAPAVLPLDVALLDVAACVAMLCAAWAWLALTVAVVEAWLGTGEPSRRSWVLPDGVRRVVLAACGLALASGTTAPALAADGAPHRHLHGIAVLTGLPLPDRAVVPPQATTRRRHTVTVRRGDSLWSIAAHDLPPGASGREISHRWHAIYAANRGRIGPDPDVLEPGQRLRLPGKDRP